MTAQQPMLFHQQQTWGHYIGKTSYPSDAAFLNEGREIGVSRRVPAFLARRMNFGDRVILLRWLGDGQARAFAEMVITGVTLGEEVAKQVAAKFADRIHCDSEIGVQQHRRGCGMYTITVTCTVHDLTLPELIEAAQQVTPQPFVMLQGRITRVISPPERLSGMRFTRGFFRFERTERLFNELPQHEGALTGIRDYTRETAPAVAEPAIGGLL